jgi:hypothetical protein
MLCFAQVSELHPSPKTSFGHRKGLAIETLQISIPVFVACKAVLKHEPQEQSKLHQYGTL